jgi:hypothetical protein
MEHPDPVLTLRESSPLILCISKSIILDLHATMTSVLMFLPILCCGLPAMHRSEHVAMIRDVLNSFARYVEYALLVIVAPPSRIHFSATINLSLAGEGPADAIQTSKSIMPRGCQCGVRTFRTLTPSHPPMHREPPPLPVILELHNAPPNPPPPSEARLPRTGIVTRYPAVEPEGGRALVAPRQTLCRPGRRHQRGPCRRRSSRFRFRAEP